MLLLYLLQIELEDCRLFHGNLVVRVKTSYKLASTYFFRFFFIIFVRIHRYCHSVSVFPERYDLTAQFMARQFQESGRIDAISIHHDSEKAIALFSPTANDGDSLTGIDFLPYLDKVLGIRCIHRLKTVCMA